MCSNPSLGAWRAARDGFVVKARAEAPRDSSSAAGSLQAELCVSVLALPTRTTGQSPSLGTRPPVGQSPMAAVAQTHRPATKGSRKCKNADYAFPNKC